MGAIETNDIKLEMFSLVSITRADWLISLCCACLSLPVPAAAAAHKSSLPPLTPQHELKLKQLTVSSLALQQKVCKECNAAHMVTPFCFC